MRTYLINNRAESSEKERYVFDGLKCVVDTVDICVAGSFIHKNRLLQIWNEYISHKVHITEVVNGKLEYRHTFDFEMDIKYLYFSNGKHFFNFNTDNRKIFGTIEIDNDVIKIYRYHSGHVSEIDYVQE